MIAPRIFKAGFFVGGEGGTALLMARGVHGWSDPAFYTVASASFGLQIGAQESEMVMFIMSDKALNALMTDKFKIGANAGIAVATLGSTVEGATTAHVGRGHHRLGIVQRSVCRFEPRRHFGGAAAECGC